MNKKFIKFGLLPLTLVFFVAVLVFFLIYSFNINNPISDKDNEIYFAIESGQGVKTISNNLEEHGLIRSQFWFDLHVWFTGTDRDFQVGGYILNTNQSIRDIVKILTSSEISGNEVTIQIPEGWTIERMGEYFEEKGLFSKEEWLDVVGHPKVDYREEPDYPEPVDFSLYFDFLSEKPTNFSWEGYLFPDTYRVYNNSRPEEVAGVMIRNLESKIDEKMLRDIKDQGYTLHEVLTMASIIEKEVRETEDMEIVSGIFWKKYREGGRLRSCATLAYILGEDKPRYSIQDTQVRSPYNTYALSGLPPGPVSNPGLRAIRAAIYPRYTNYNFFLSRPDTGETVFSETYNEHEANKQRYLN